jgi:hypothetical protein
MGEYFIFNITISLSSITRITILPVIGDIQNLVTKIVTKIENTLDGFLA